MPLLTRRERTWSKTRSSPLLAWMLLAGAAAVAEGAGPQVARFFPAGCQRGAATTIRAEGSFAQWPVQVWVQPSGLEVKAEAEKGRFQVAADARARPGVYWLRCHDNRGAGALRPLLVGSLPEHVEEEPNDPAVASKIVRLPSVINGRLQKAGDVDSFVVKLQAGQRLVASCMANRVLGSPMDAVLQICTARGVVLRQNDDQRGLDPELVFAPAIDGDYVVRLFAFPETPNSSIAFAGGESFVYRLTLTCTGFIDHVQPLFLRRAAPNQLTIRGWGLPRETVSWSLTPSEDLPLSLLAHPQLAGCVPAALADGQPHVLKEPDDEEHLATYELPAYLTGCLDKPGDRDLLRVPATKGASLRIRVESRSLGFATDPLLRVTDEQGKLLAEADDGKQERDPELVVKSPADGPLRIQISDLHDRGGLRFAYRLSITQEKPAWEIILDRDAWEAKVGQKTKLPFLVRSRVDFSGDVKVTVSGLPAFASCPDITVQVAKNKETKGELVLTTKAEAGGYSGPFTVAAVSEDGVRQVAACGAATPWGQPHHQAWLTLTAP